MDLADGAQAVGRLQPHEGDVDAAIGEALASGGGVGDLLELERRVVGPERVREPPPDLEVAGDDEHTRTRVGRHRGEA